MVKKGKYRFIDDLYTQKHLIVGFRFKKGIKKSDTLSPIRFQNVVQATSVA